MARSVESDSGAPTESTVAGWARSVGERGMTNVIGDGGQPTEVGTGGRTNNCNCRLSELGRPAQEALTDCGSVGVVLSFH